MSPAGDGSLDASTPTESRLEPPLDQGDGIRSPSPSPSPVPTSTADVSRESPLRRLRAGGHPRPVQPAGTATHARGPRVSRETPVLPLPGRPPPPRPAGRRVIAVANQKGGVGKTTSTVNLAVGLALQGARVLVVDLDPQGNASTGFAVDHQAGVASIYDVLIDQRPLIEVVVPAPDVPGLLCAPATIDLAGAEIELVSVVARESRLRKAISAYSDQVDYVFIDCPPSLGLLTVNALVAAEEVLIPIQCEYYALEGLSQLLASIDLVRTHLNPDLRLSTILLTMYDARTRLADQVADEVRQHFGDVVLSTTIPRSVRVSEAPGYGQSVLTYDPTSRGAVTYLAAAREFAERGVAAEAAR